MLTTIGEKAYPEVMFLNKSGSHRRVRVLGDYQFETIRARSHERSGAVRCVAEGNHCTM